MCHARHQCEVVDPSPHKSRIIIAIYQKHEHTLRVSFLKTFDVKKDAKIINSLPPHSGP